MEEASVAISRLPRLRAHWSSALCGLYKVSVYDIGIECVWLCEPKIFVQKGEINKCYELTTNLFDCYVTGVKLFLASSENRSSRRIPSQFSLYTAQINPRQWNFFGILYILTIGVCQPRRRVSIGGARWRKLNGVHTTSATEIKLETRRCFHCAKLHNHCCYVGIVFV